MKTVIFVVVRLVVGVVVYCEVAKLTLALWLVTLIVSNLRMKT